MALVGLGWCSTNQWLAAQQASVFGSVGAGLSVTPKAEDPGIPLLALGVGGKGAAVSADAGLWLSRWFGIAGEASLGFPFETVQTEGGVGLCCSTLTRDHRLTFLSGVAKVRVASALVLQGGVSALRISTSEVRVTTPLGGVTHPPVESTFSRTRAAWTVGAEAEVPLSRAIRLVPAARVFVSRPKDDIAEANPLALGHITYRFTVSLRAASGQ